MIVAIENCCAPPAVKRTLFLVRSVIAVQHDILYALNVIVIRRLVQRKLIVTELYT